MSDPLKIITRHIYPPIPDRRFDWEATFDNYDIGSPCGHGATEEEAIADLLLTADADLDLAKQYNWGNS